MNISRLRKNARILLNNNEVIGRTNKNEQLEISFSTVPENNDSEQAADNKSMKKKNADYASVYFEQSSPFKRCQTYVEQEVYQIIKHFLSTVAPEMSVAGYISNILSKHLEENKDEIEKLYADKVNLMKTSSLWKK